ncbi:MAG: sulfatase-like hydrolase/transferase, partial [Planctomycetales bacterium]|nr:sulfatase-like hydrolase/transferase [Planctomycetales bacterium]
PKFLPDNEVVREDFADYLGEAMAFDAAVGVLIEELERIGELDNTLVVISGDHGAPGFPRGKCNLYDFGTQVLLAARMPGKIVAGREIDKPVSLIDLASTYLEVAGLAATEDMNGQSLWSAMTSGEEDYEQDLRGFAITGRETHVDVAREAGYPYPMRGIRTKDHLYVINFKPERWPVAVPPLAAPLQRLSDMRQDSNGDLVRRTDIDFGPTRDYFFSHEDDPQLAPLWQLGLGLRPAEELYVVASDPDQMQNRADDPELADVKAQLREQLMDELKRNGDPRVVGTGDGFDRAPYRKPVPPDTGLPVEP